MNGDSQIESWEIDEDSVRSLNGWTLKLDLTYETSKHIALIGTSYFIGWAATLLWVPRLGDVYGRKKMFILSNVINTLNFVIVLFTKSLNVMIIAFFILGLASSIRVNIGYNYLIEMYPDKYKIAVGTTWNVGEGLIYLSITLFFWLTAYGSWLWLVGLGFII
jgi:MFS family permease